MSAMTHPNACVAALAGVLVCGAGVVSFECALNCLSMMMAVIVVYDYR